MGEREYKEVASGVIAAAEAAVSSLAERREHRAAQLHKLADLFVVVEQRYQALRQDLQERERHIQLLEETNETLLTALRSLTAQVRENADALETGDTDMAEAIGRSESLVSQAFGTGGNANPTQAPDAAPAQREADEPPLDLEDLELSLSAPAAEADSEPAGRRGSPEDRRGAPAVPVDEDDDLVFEEAPHEPEHEPFDDADMVTLDPGPEPASALDQDTELALVSDAPEPEADEAAEAASRPDGSGAAGDDDTQPVEWADTWSVGAPAMDHDHRVLINLINELPQAFRTPDSEWVVGSVLNNLWDYTTYHFDREEALLRAANFPGAGEHAHRHASLKDQVRTWLDRYQSDPAAVDAHALQAFLKGWLMNHILGEDMRYRPYIENNPDAQALAAAIPADPELLARLGDAALPDQAVSSAAAP